MEFDHDQNRRNPPDVPDIPAPQPGGGPGDIRKIMILSICNPSKPWDLLKTSSWKLKIEWLKWEYIVKIEDWILWDMNDLTMEIHDWTMEMDGNLVVFQYGNGDSTTDSWFNPSKHAEHHAEHKSETT